MPEPTTPPANQEEEDDINIDALFGDNTETTPPTKTEDKGEEGKGATDPDAIAKAIAEGIKQGVEAVTTTTTRSSEVDKYLSSEEGQLVSKYADKIKQVALSPQYKNLPVENVVGLVLGTKLATIAAAEKERLREKGRENQGGNQGNANNARQGDGEQKSPWELSGDEFKQMQADAKAGKYLPK